MDTSGEILILKHDDECQRDRAIKHAIRYGLRTIEWEGGTLTEAQQTLALRLDDAVISGRKRRQVELSRDEATVAVGALKQNIEFYTKNDSAIDYDLTATRALPEIEAFAGTRTA